MHRSTSTASCRTRRISSKTRRKATAKAPVDIQPALCFNEITERRAGDSLLQKTKGCERKLPSCVHAGGQTRMLVLWLLLSRCRNGRSNARARFFAEENERVRKKASSATGARC